MCTPSNRRSSGDSLGRLGPQSAVARPTIASRRSANASRPKYWARSTAPADSRASSSGSPISATVWAKRSDHPEKCRPFTPGYTPSPGPASPSTTGTAPADMASTIEMPKCSMRLGSDSASSPSPVACQKIDARP